MAPKLSSFLAEMKRRKVYHVAVVYVVVGLGILGAAEVILDPLGLGDLRKYIVILVLLGLPIALVLAWAYEVKPEEPRITMKALASAIASPGSKRKSIVVLPFDNMSPDPGDAYFADGLTEEIITNLSHIRSLRVISRTSAMMLKGTQKDVRTIGQDLDVQYVLEGSVRKAGDQLRITAQLIQAETDEHLWAEKHDGVLEDVFGIQESVSRSIVDAMEVHLAPAEERRLTERPIDNVQAYDCHLRARFAMDSWTEDGFDRALQHLRSGVSVIGENARLFAGIGYTHWLRVNAGVGGEEDFDRAEQHARKALELDPDCAEAHLVLGVVFQSGRGDQRGAWHHLRRSLEINPYDPHAVLHTCWTHFIVGRPEASRPHVERIIQSDPLNVLNRFYPSVIAMGSGQFDQHLSVDWTEATPTPPVFFFRTLALVWTNQLDEARTVIHEWMKYEWEDLFGSFCTFIEAAIERDRERMDGYLAGDQARTCHLIPEVSYWVAGLFAVAGAEDAAIKWVTNAVDRGFINYPLLAEHDPFLTKFRGEPRYDALLERVRTEWETFEV